MNIRSYVLLSTILLASCFVVSAQTSIEALQNTNGAYLARMESEGFEFRSQIITEFNQDNAEQKVNINLKEGYTYQLVAIGDSEIHKVDLAIKSSRKFDMTDLGDVKIPGSEKVKEMTPQKSGEFKISLNVERFSNAGKGFVSFMVLRKK